MHCTEKIKANFLKEKLRITCEFLTIKMKEQPKDLKKSMYNSSSDAYFTMLCGGRRGVANLLLMVFVHIGV